MIPFPLSSASAAIWLLKRGASVDAIYIDASHEEQEVYQDILDYFPLVRSGGILFGDDWEWLGVRNSVTRYAKQNRLKVHFVDDKMDS